MTEQVNYEKVVTLGKGEIAALIDTLSSADGIQRSAAREQLEKIGQPAVPFLVETLQSPSDHARWEAAKALGQIADPAAAPALVHALQDGKSGVRWLAATALINLGHAALAPLLRGLEGHADSIWFRDSAHHVLHSLVRDGVADEALPVLDALENIEPAVEAPIAAYQVLQQMKRQEEASSSLAQ